MLTQTERDRLLVDVRYAMNQLKRFRDVARAVDALERVEADLEHPAEEEQDLVDLGGEDPFEDVLARCPHCGLPMQHFEREAFCDNCTSYRPTAPDDLIDLARSA
jgi:rubrerythrin